MRRMCSEPSHTQMHTCVVSAVECTLLGKCDCVVSAFICVGAVTLLVFVARFQVEDEFYCDACVRFREFSRIRESWRLVVELVSPREQFHNLCERNDCRSKLSELLFCIITFIRSNLWPLLRELICVHFINGLAMSAELQRRGSVCSTRSALWNS